MIVAALLLILPSAVILAEAEDSEGLELYEVYFHIQGGGKQMVSSTSMAHPPEVDGVLFWTMKDPGAVDTEGIAVVDASDVWNPNRNYRHDLDLYPVTGAFILVDDAGLAPADWSAIGIATALGAILGAALALVVVRFVFKTPTK